LKRKVIHIVNDLKVGGITTLLYDILKNNTDSSFEYEIINLSGESDTHILQLFYGLRINIHKLNFAFEGGYSLLDHFKKSLFRITYLKKNRSIIDYILKLSPDILHFHTLPRELILGHAVSKTIKCKLVVTDHLARLKKEEIKYISRFLLRIPFYLYYNNYHVIAVSSAVYNYLYEFRINRTVRSITIITNKIPKNEYRIKYISKRELKVVYVARISPVKGHYDLIKAWSLLPNLNLHLYIVGPDEMNGFIHEQVIKNSIQNKISFTGSINNVSEFISDADMGIFPSYKEGLPIALLEKMQLGIPCIVTDIEELKTVIEDGVDGLIFKKADIFDLSCKIKILAQDIALRKKIGVSASRKIENLYTSRLGGINKEYEEYYKAIN
jgi:glycosyltransferase involved in cell wall biosynthesis